MAKEPEIHKGLAGVVVDTTAVSEVIQELSSLTYRGYPVDELARLCTFEEVAYLLWNGELPTRSQLNAFKKAERAERELSPRLLRAIAEFPGSAHPMDTIRTAVSFLGTEEVAWGGEGEAKDRARAMKMLAKIPAMIATDFRLRNGKRRVKPKPELSMAENFLNMCFGKVPPKEVVRAFDVSLILYAEHSFNASTFTARVVSSTRADIYGAVTAAIAALKGPLHGGANEAVMHMLKEIGAPDKAEAWLRKRLANKELVMGFGHRVYRKGDSRVPTMKRALADMSAYAKDDTWMRISEVMENIMVGEKNIYPNLDFPAGPAYYLMGFPIDLYTPIFVMSRITGWCAHVFEQSADNRLIRPLSAYTGRGKRKVKPIAQR